jgi:hypothetical protein
VQLRKLRDERSAWVSRFDERSLAFAGYRPIVERLSSSEGWPTIEALSLIVADEGRRRGAPVPAMVLQGPRRRGPRDRASLYDAHIIERGEVPTRHRHWHDTMNALVWAAFPLAKYALHRRQYDALCAAVDHEFAAIPGARTKEHDAIAMLDEGGVVVLAERSVAREIEDALREPRSQHLEAAICNNKAALFVFGHGILESVLLAQGLPATHAFACVVPCDSVPSELTLAREMTDEMLAHALASRLAPTFERPLPSVALSEPWLESIARQL